MISQRRAISESEDKERRFFVLAQSSTVLALQSEAVARCVDPWRLGGEVIANWIQAGCPDQIEPREA